MSRLERRRATVVRRIVPIDPVLHVVVEVLRVDAAGIVDRFGQRVGDLRAQPVRIALHEAELQRVVKRFRVGDALEDWTEIRVAASELRLIRLDAVHDRLRSQVRIADADQIAAARADVAGEHVPVAG